MSSAAPTTTTPASNESVKQPPGEKSADEPSSKKVKLADGDTNDAATVNNKTTDANNKATAMKNVDNNNGNQTTSVPSKSSTSNGAGSDNKKDEHAAGASVDNDDDSDDEALQFDPTMTKNLGECERIQSEICNLNEKASEEILKVEQKFNKLRRPFFEKRNELLKTVPNFWVTSMANHQIIAPMIGSPEDEDCLHYMENLDVEEFEDIKSGYRLKLHFVENPYITNEVIVKEFHILTSDDVQSSSTPIEFKNTRQGKALKQVVENSIAQFRRSRRPGQVTTHQSFFAWLLEPSNFGPDEVAEILKDQIYPNPLEFFFASPDGDYGDDSDDDESDDEDEEIDDEELDDDEDNVITEGDMNESFDEEADIEGEGDDDDEDDEEEEGDDEDEGNEE